MKKINTKLDSRNIMFNNNINKHIIVLFDSSLFGVFFAIFLVRSPPISESNCRFYPAGRVAGNMKRKSDFTRGVGQGRTNCRQIFNGALSEGFPAGTALFRTRIFCLFGIVCTIPQQIESRTNCKMQEPVTKTSTDIWRPANRLQESN